MGVPVSQQVQRALKQGRDRIVRVKTTAVNRAAQRLAAMARGAARGRSYGDTRGRSIVQSIVVRRSERSDNPRAVVFLDTQKVPHAAYVHENYRGYHITPKVKTFLYIPLTAAGRRHKLHANDSESLRLKGWMVAGRKSRPVGYWPELQHGMMAGMDMSEIVRGSTLDFILKKSQDVPANPRAGFLTRTAQWYMPQLQASIGRDIDTALKGAA